MSPNGTHRFSRRTVLRTSAVLAGSGLAIGSYALTATDRATAQVAIGNLDIPDAFFEDTDGQPAGVFVFVDGRYEFAVDSEPAAYRLYLFLRDTGGGFHAIDTAETATVSREASGTFSLGGDILDTDAYGASDFQAPGPGQSKTIHVPLGVLIQVLDAEGTVLADGETTRAVKIGVTEKGLSAEVGAEGSVVFQPDAEDPTPTAPG